MIVKGTTTSEFSIDLSTAREITFEFLKDNFDLKEENVEIVDGNLQYWYWDNMGHNSTVETVIIRKATKEDYAIIEVLKYIDKEKSHITEKSLKEIVIPFESNLFNFSITCLYKIIGDKKDVYTHNNIEIKRKKLNKGSTKDVDRQMLEQSFSLFCDNVENGSFDEEIMSEILLQVE